MLSKSLCAAAVAATLFAVPAIAGDTEQRSITVRYGDLNLASEAGAAALAERVNRAAVSVCGPEETRRLEEVLAFKECRFRAIAKARPQMKLAIDAARESKAYARAEPMQVCRTGERC